MKNKKNNEEKDRLKRIIEEEIREKMRKPINEYHWKVWRGLSKRNF